MVQYSKFTLDLNLEHSTSCMFDADNISARSYVHCFNTSLMPAK